MTQQEIIRCLIVRDERVTQQFFFKDCRPLFMSIIRYVFPYEVNYDEFVNEFYLHLMENDAYRLRQFEGRSSIYQWLKIVAIRYFMAKKNRMIDMKSSETLIVETVTDNIEDEEKRATAHLEIEHLLSLMSNQRQIYVIKRLVLEDTEPQKVADELNVTVDNLYNIKKRAIAALTKIALNATEKYE